VNTKATFWILTLGLVLSATGCIPFHHRRHVRFVAGPDAPHTVGLLDLEAVQVRPETKNLSTLVSGLVATVGRAGNLKLSDHVGLHVDAGFQLARLNTHQASDETWDRRSPSWDLPDARSAAHLDPKANAHAPYANVALTVEL
jgi:hypothetical protein